MANHPLQPIVLDKFKTPRFKANKIVEYLVEGYKLDLILKSPRWSREDLDQLIQLIGYSVSGAPLSEACRAEVEETIEHPDKSASFRAGFVAGHKQAVCKMLSAIEEIDEVD